MSLEDLTKSQRRVFHHLMEGKNSKEIASDLHRAVQTVDAHVKIILAKFHCRTRARLIVRHYRGQL